MADANDPARLLGVPAAKPPAGVLPNHENPYSDGRVLIIVGSTLVAIMLLFVSVRFYTKVKIVGKSSADDCKFDFNPFNPILIPTDTCMIATVCHCPKHHRTMKIDVFPAWHCALLHYCGLWYVL